MDSVVVEFQKVVKHYRRAQAVDEVSLNIRRGEIFALLGPNGAGKTTLISIAAGLARATRGTVAVLGKDVVRDYRFTRRAIGLVPQEINFDPFFTVEESLRIQAGYFDVKLSEERLQEILRALDLEGKRSAPSRSLSGGMRRRLLIGKALVHAPQILFLDEPTAGVDVELRHSLWDYVRTLRERGTTIVLTTHYLEEAEELADRIGVMNKGKLLLVDDKTSILEKHGGKTLTVNLAAAVEKLPGSLTNLGVSAGADQRSLIYNAAHGARLGMVLEAISTAGLIPVDVHTRQKSLEDIFVDLVRKKDAL